MMKRLYIASTIVFWIAVAAIWGAGRVAASGQQASTRSSEPIYTMDDVAAHSSAEDCWMAIGGEVYELTAYLPQHPTRPSVIVPWCGKEATHAYNTKNSGRPHSSYATGLLKQYRIGALDATAP